VTDVGTGGKVAVSILALLVLLVIVLLFRGGPSSEETQYGDERMNPEITRGMLETCLKADRERISLYGAAKPTEDCKRREAAYALQQTGK